MSQSRTVDMLHGSISKKIAIVAVPIALTSLLQQVFNATDLIVVGRFTGKEALAAVGSNTPLINLLVMLMVGIAMGANVVISRFIGAGEHTETRKAVHTTVLLGVLCGCIVLLLGEALAKPALHLLGVPPDVLPQALLYLRIYFLAMPVLMLYNFLSAIFRSFGDTRTPLICLASGGVLNVVLDLLFVAGFHWGVAGVAVATSTASLVSALLLLSFLLRSQVPDMLLSIQELRMDRTILGRILRIGLPSGFQGMLFSLSNVVLQSAINSLGATVMAGSSAGLNVEIFVYYIVNAYGQAVTSFVSQNYGANQLDRCRKTTRVGLLQESIVCVVSCVLLMLAARPLLSIFNTDPAVIEVGYIRMKALITLHVINGALEIFSGTLRGYGKSMTPAVISFLAICVYRIIWVYTYFRSAPTFENLVLCYPISWFLAVIALVVAYFYILRQLQRSASPGVEQAA